MCLGVLHCIYQALGLIVLALEFPSENEELARDVSRTAEVKLTEVNSS